MGLFKKAGLINSMAVTIMLLYGMPLFCQEDQDTEMLTREAGEFIFSNPDESIKIGNHLLKRKCSDKEFSEINLLMAESYNTKGDYNNIVKYVFEAGKKAYAVNDSLKVSILLLKAKVAGNLYLDNQFEGYLNEAQNILAGTSNKNIKEALEASIVLEKARINILRQNYDVSLALLDSIERNSKAIKSVPYLQLRFAIAQGIALSGDDNVKQSGIVLKNALSQYYQMGSTNALHKVYIYYGLSTLYFKQQEYKAAIDMLLIALKEAERIGNLMLMREVNNQLALNYLALNNKEEHRKYNEAFMNLIMQVEDMEVEAVNTMYSLIGQENEALVKAREDRYSVYTYILSGILILISGFGVILYYNNKAKKRRLKEIISYLELSSVSNAVLKSTADKKETHKRLAIPTETEQAILGKLKKFEATTKFTHKDMSLATLAAQLDVNTKYLSEIINKHYQDNFNTYINKLRINYIIEKLRNNPEYLHYKISYLAEESGFSSHSSFATIFKSITGIAPTTFIDLLGQEVNNKQEVNY